MNFIFPLVALVGGYLFLNNKGGSSSLASVVITITKLDVAAKIVSYSIAIAGKNYTGSKAFSDKSTTNFTTGLPTGWKIITSAEGNEIVIAVIDSKSATLIGKGVDVTTQKVRVLTEKDAS